VNLGLGLGLGLILRLGLGLGDTIMVRVMDRVRFRDSGRVSWA
jgi:hypothetical protein